MVVRINVGAKPAGAVLYNEHKVAHGEARFIGGYNSTTFEREAISVNQKINVLERYVATNARIGKPTFHASLAFHPSEQFSDDQLKLIGQQYMERLGYGEQPYLVYRHEDTHHPHIHIVSVSIDHEGKRVSDSHQQRRSNAIRQALEKEHGLIEAEKQGKEVLMSGLLPEQVLSYKEPEAKKAIGNVVRTALTDYNFSNVQTFAEFLHQHRVQMNQLGGVTADGKPYKGITFQLHNGKNDQRGEAIGPAIKASRFAFAPTYERLESKFKQNATRVSSGKEATRQRIHSSLEAYNQLSEGDFKAQLRSAGIQVIDTGQQYVYIDHKSRNVYAENELGANYTRSVQRANFSDQSIQLNTPRNRVKATATPIDKKTQTAKPAGSTKPKQQPFVPTPEPTAQELALRRRVSHVYQQIRQQGSNGKKPVFFESQLIRQFPHEQLTRSLVGEGVSPLAARQAVAQFETYKQSQLPDIRAKEEAYFLQTASQFVSLASQLPLSAASKRAFLGAADYVVSADSSTITHREDNQLRYPIPASVQNRLDQDQGTSLAFRDRLTKPERSLYGALASGHAPADSLSFYQVSAAHFKTATGPLFDRVALGLNKAYTDQVSSYLREDKPLGPQLQARGLLIEALPSGAYRMGHYLTSPTQFSAVPDNLARRLQREALPVMADQLDALRSPAGRSLVTLSQAQDMNHTTTMEQELGRWYRQTNQSAGSGSVVEQARALQTHLQSQLTTPAQQIPGLTPEKRSATNSTSERPLPVSTLGQGLVSLLVKTNLSPQQRYQITTQLGLIWQRSASGQLRLREGENSAHPGRVYSLTPTQQSYFNRPASSEPINPRLNTADQDLLRAISQGQPYTQLNRQQVARLTLPVVESLLPKENRADFQRWYNERRGNQILSDNQHQFGEQASARRYLSALYQRGFLVKQDVDTSGKPTYRMGYFKADPASYVTVPNEINQAFTRQFPTQPGKNAYVLEGAWPAPDSVMAQRMRALARSVDSGAEAGRVNKLITGIQDRFPHLASVQQPQTLLDRLVSQPRIIRQPADGLDIPNQRQGASPHTPASSVSLQATDRVSTSDRLQSLLDQFDHQAPQKGLLDILGESASAIRPKKKRVGEDQPVKRRSRKR